MFHSIEAFVVSLRTIIIFLLCIRFLRNFRFLFSILSSWELGFPGCAVPCRCDMRRRLTMFDCNLTNKNFHKTPVKGGKCHSEYKSFSLTWIFIFFIHTFPIFTLSSFMSCDVMNPFAQNVVIIHSILKMFRLS